MEWDSVLRQVEGDCLLRVKLVPRSARNRVVGVENGELKIKIIAPPVEGAANEALLRFISDLLGAAKTDLTVERGKASRHKVVKLRGMNIPEVTRVLEKNLKAV